MTQLAVEHKAINLSQGFPDFSGPPDIIEAAHTAMRAGHNQYARSQGHPLLVQQIAAHQRHYYGLDLDPMAEVGVFSGATEGLAASFLGLLDPGDEVILFEPFYDSYPACTALAGAQARYCTLRAPDFAIDWDELRALFNTRTRLLVLNTPHNPSGKVFSREELERIAALCREHDVWVLADEVYEHLLFDGAQHIPMATLPEMWQRTLTLSSAGKTYSHTGWKIGWATGPRPLVAAAQAAHQFLTFAVATPFQLAIAHALERHRDEYVATFQEEYRQRRDFLLKALRGAGLQPITPRGTYFIVAEFSALHSGDDREFVRWLVKHAGIAAVPCSPFYQAELAAGRKLVRFAFCKRMETLRAAAERLAELRP
jgi:N-succinyldiaminopimelate aminotransferase